MGKNKAEIVISLLSVVFLSISHFYPSLSVLTFPGIALALLILQKKDFKSKSALLWVIFTIVFLLWNSCYTNDNWTDWLMPVTYSTALTLVFTLYVFTKDHVRNRLGLFTMCIYWLALEFLLYSHDAQYSRFMIATAFDAQPYFISWNAYTGYMGISLWVMLGAVLLAKSWPWIESIKMPQIHWGWLIIALIVILLPLVIPFHSSYIVQHDLVDGHNKQLAGSGEYIGRTALWVAILLTLFSFVKKEVSA